MFSLLLILVAVAGIAVLWKVSEDEVVATLTQAENGGVVAVEDYVSVCQSDGTAGDEATGGETLLGEKTADESGCFASEYLAVIADELESIRVMNTGNLESLVRAVLAGEGWCFDYEHVVTRATGDAETESYITAIYSGEEENEDCFILRIYLASVVLSTDKENQDIESRYPSEEDYDMESEAGAEAYEEANMAADTSLKYSWTFDVGNSDGETAYLYYNYSLQSATGTKELVERVELVGSDASSAVSILCRMENIPVMRNENSSDTHRLQAAQDGCGWNLEVKSAYRVTEGIQISSKMFFRETIIKDTAKSTLTGLAITFAVGAAVFAVINHLMEPYLNLTFETFRIRMLPGVTAITLLAGIGSTLIGCGIGLRHITRMQAAEALKAEECP